MGMLILMALIFGKLIFWTVLAIVFFPWPRR
jgi:hypothetical protein